MVKRCCMVKRKVPPFVDCRHLWIHNQIFSYANLRFLISLHTIFKLIIFKLLKLMLCNFHFMCPHFKSIFISFIMVMTINMFPFCSHLILHLFIHQIQKSIIIQFSSGDVNIIHIFIIVLAI